MDDTGNTVALSPAAWTLTFHRLLLCASLGQGVESLGVKVNISTFRVVEFLKHSDIVSQDGAVEICVAITTNHSMCGIFFYPFHSE